MENLSATRLVEEIHAGNMTSADCLQHFANVTVGKEPTIHAFCTNAFEQASRSLAGKGEMAGVLAGIPVAVKDGICTRQMKTTACSAMLEHFVPSYDATVVSRLRSAGAIIAGKTNMDEFSMGSSTENSFFGVTRNPWDQTRSPGGSSGGSAAAVAAGMVPLALGSDTGGSIRQPAAFCGITGLKPTYGRVSRLGLIAFASSLDQIGPMGRCAEDIALLLSVIAGHDAGDATSASLPVPDYRASLNDDFDGLRIGICESQLNESVDPAIIKSIRQALTVFESLGATIVKVKLPHEKYSVAAYYVAASCEASSNLSRYDGVRYTARSDTKLMQPMYTQTRSEHFGNEVKRRILLGTFALSSGYYDQFYVKASRVRRLIKQDFENAFRQVDLIVGPTTPTTAFPIGERISDPIKMYLADVFTVSANLAGIPAMSIPGGFSAGLPIGLQLQGPALSEAKMLNAAHQFQLQTDWHQRRPF